MSDNVLDFGKKKNEIIEKRRRNFERVMFESFLGCYTAVDKGAGLYPIRVVDISKTGLLFEVSMTDVKESEFHEGKIHDFRFYFSKTNYIPARIKIIHSYEHTEKNGITYRRFGCQIDQNHEYFDVLTSFVDFMQMLAERSIVDKGDTKVYFL